MSEDGNFPFIAKPFDAGDRARDFSPSLEEVEKLLKEWVAAERGPDVRMEEVLIWNDNYEFREYDAHEEDLDEGLDL